MIKFVNSKDIKKIKPDKEKYISNAILNKLEKQTQKILIIGEVQSGKTNRIINIIDEAFETYKYNVIFLFGGTTITLNKQTKNRLEKHIKSNKLDYKLLDFDKQYLRDEHFGKKIIYLGPKHSKSIDDMYYRFHDIPNIKNQKILIIDDECDYATINTKNNETSSYYEKIMTVYSKLQNGGFIGVTATPYCNIVTNKDYTPYRLVVKIPRNDEYTGLDYFISNSDKIFIDTKKQLDYFENRDSLYNLLYYSYLVWVKNSILKLKRYPDSKTEMLINLSTGIVAHDNYSKLLKEIIKFSIINKSSFLKHFKIVLDQFQMNEITEDDIEKFYFQLCFKGKTSLINIDIMNSKNKPLSNNSKYTIFVGGINLSRGVTFENLTIELILNFPKSKIKVDSYLQMCRWFGYRKKFIDYINVITDQRFIDAFISLKEYNDIFNFPDSDNCFLSLSDIKNKIINIDKKNKILESCSNEKK